MTRLTTFVIALILIVTTPYWMYLPAILLGVIFFPLYIEAIFLGLLIDVVYGRPDVGLLGFPFGIIAAALVFLAVPLREHLRFNA
jgi:hypothetical protein